MCAAVWLAQRTVWASMDMRMRARSDFDMAVIRQRTRDLCANMAAIPLDVLGRGEDMREALCYFISAWMQGVIGDPRVHPLPGCRLAHAASSGTNCTPMR